MDGRRRWCAERRQNLTYRGDANRHPLEAWVRGFFSGGHERLRVDPDGNLATRRRRPGSGAHDARTKVKGPLSGAGRFGRASAPSTCLGSREDATDAGAHGWRRNETRRERAAVLSLSIGRFLYAPVVFAAG